MAEVTYELVEGWEKRPAGYKFRDVSGVGVDSRDRVYVLTRSDARVIVYERDGTFVGSFAEGTFTNRTHGIFIGPDDMVYVVDDGDHTVRKFTPEGELVMMIGTPGVASDTGIDNSLPSLYDKLKSIPRGGPPFNKCTDVAIAPNGDIYVTDGYGNARVHHFTADGKLIQSWGEPGVGPGRFNLPHGIWVAADGRVFVTVRENDCVQIFGPTGEFLEQWTNVQRPTDIFMDKHGNVFVSELAWLEGQMSFVQGKIEKRQPGSVSVLDMQGNVIQRIGGEDGFAPGNFWAPHTLCVDSHGDLYVGEVNWSFSGLGKAGKIPEDVHLLQKFARKEK